MPNIDGLYQDLGSGQWAQKVQSMGSSLKQTQLSTDQTAVYANSDPANTQKTINFTAPTSPSQEYELIVYNPSTVTDLTIKVFNTELVLGAGSRDALITTVSIPKSQTFTGTTINTYARFIHGMFNGGDLKLVVSNDTVLGAADAFTAYARLRAV